MSDSESSSLENLTPVGDQMSFISVLKRNTILLDKSQKPETKSLKETAIKNFAIQYAELTGKTVEKGKILKKLSNMKKRVKEKTDLKKTGNKKIKLSSWENEMFNLLQGDINPVFSKVSGATSIGFGSSNPTCSTSMLESCDVVSQATPVVMPKTHLPKIFSSSSANVISKSIIGKKAKVVLPQETEETLALSNEELQRLVLLEQLAVLRLQKQKLQSEIDEQDLFKRVSNM